MDEANALTKARGDDGLTDRERNLVALMVQNGWTVKQAADSAGFSSAAGAYQAWRREAVQQAFFQASQLALKDSVPVAIATLKSLATKAKSEKVRLEAAATILDRSGHGVQAQGVKLSADTINIQINL